MKFRVLLLAPLAVAAMTLGTGCSNKTAAERDSLLKQNQDLNAQLEQEKAARAAAEAARNSTPAPDTSATTAPAAPSMDAGTPDMSANSGPSSADLGGGVSRGKNKLGEDTVRVSSDVLFDSGKATLKPAAKKALDKVVSILKKEYNGRQLRVEGHTDPNPVKHSGWDDNWDLGAARARAVMLYLRQHGVRDMYIASFADTELKSTKNFAADRRVEIVVVRNGK